jgi:hypothetical protein
MAETTGTPAPNYKLSQGTQKRVFDAGVNPTNEKSGKTARQHLTNAAIADGVDAIATGVKDQIVEKREDTETRERKWDAGLESMGVKGSWANASLFDQFLEIEKAHQKEYREAVRKGDKKGQQRMLKDQGERSQQLQSWKGLMETGYKIHKEYGWGEAIEGESPQAARNRTVLDALYTLDGSADVYVSKDGPNKGEMVFDVPEIGEVSYREAEEILTGGMSPMVREESAVGYSIKAHDLGAEGKYFSERGTYHAHQKALAKELRGSGESKAISILQDAWYGETSLEDDLRDAINKPQGGIEFKIEVQGGLIDGDGSGFIESHELNKANTDILLEALKNDPKLLAEVAADWQTKKDKNIHKTALDEYNKNKSETSNSGGIAR